MKWNQCSNFFWVAIHTIVVGLPAIFHEFQVRILIHYSFQKKIQRLSKKKLREHVLENFWASFRSQITNETTFSNTRERYISNFLCTKWALLTTTVSIQNFYFYEPQVWLLFKSGCNSNFFNVILALKIPLSNHL